METILHLYHPTRHLNLLEYTPLPTSLPPPTLPSRTPSNVLLFVGGLYDNFGTPPYVSDIARLFPRHEGQQWCVMHVQLSSAMRSWGVSNLSRDTDEMATCITYIRSTVRGGMGETNVVLMGHSTGCQDTVYYLHTTPTPKNGSLRPKVQGAILQAPVSDREAVLQDIARNSTAKDGYEAALKLARQTPREEWNSTILKTTWSYPLFGPAPLSVERFMSLVSPDTPERPSGEDLFSSDLGDQRLKETLGAIAERGILVGSGLGEEGVNGKREVPTSSVLILISGDDTSMPSSIDKQALLERWGRFVSLSSSSKVIPNAKHDVSGEEAPSLHARLVDLCGSVVRYLDEVVGGVDEVTYGILRENERLVKMQEGRAEGVKL